MIAQIDPRAIDKLLTNVYVSIYDVFFMSKLLSFGRSEFCEVKLNYLLSEHRVKCRVSVLMTISIIKFV